MKEIIYFYILNIIIGELLIPDYQTIGLGIHLINILAIVLVIIFTNLELKIKNILQGLTLIILLRVVNLSTPQFFTTDIIQYSIIYGIMFIPVYYIIKSQQIPSKELGIYFKKLYIYLPIAIIIGTIMAIIEYKILNPAALIEKFRLSDIISLIVVMFIFIGAVEEIIFRSILQTRLEKIFNIKYSIIISGGIFGIMHASYGILGEILFASVFGIILGYVFYKTRSLPFIVSIHGITNIILFVLPIILGDMIV